MARNIEIKARLADPAHQHRIARELSGSPAQILSQEDVFFNCPQGRLKLRVFSAAQGELIYYERPDQIGRAHV